MNGWRCARCNQDARGCHCCMLCDQSGEVLVVMRCLIDPRHDLTGNVCLQHQLRIFGFRDVDAKCSQCFPDQASIERENAAYPNGRPYVAFSRFVA